MIHADPDHLRNVLWPPDRNGASGDIFARVRSQKAVTHRRARV